MGDYVSTHLDKVQNTPGGKLCQVFGKLEHASCSVAIVKMEPSNNGVCHYHDNITEIYIFTKGKGKIVINGHENEIKGGECYIITPGNVHYIEAIEEMDFLCICTPPWEESHEFIVNDIKLGNNILKCDKYGILQKLSDDIDHNISRVKIMDDFVLINKAEFRRVYYFVSGKGSIVIDNIEYNIMPGDCYEVLNNSCECIKPNGEVEFISIYDEVL